MHRYSVCGSSSSWMNRCEDRLHARHHRVVGRAKKDRIRWYNWLFFFCSFIVPIVAQVNVSVVVAPDKSSRVG
jgi:hypothetical protein